MKRTLALLLAIMMLFSFAACSKPAEAPAEDQADAEPAAPEKVVVNLYAFTDEVPNMVDKYIEDNDLGDTVEINKTIIATTDGAYQPALDQALQNGEVDMYVAESAFVLKYTQGDAAEFAATYKDLGIDIDKELKSAEIAPYTYEIGTRPSDNEVVALAYQSCGGCFIYRNDVAVKVWGDEADNNPDFVAEKIGAGTGAWDKFEEAAADCAKAGVAIVSGDGDVWHAIENSSDSPWIVDGKLNIDPKREAFIEFSKKLYDNKWTNKTTDWTDNWYADMSENPSDKPVLGYYGPAWLINYVIGGNAGATAGEWRVCAPNVGFLWGGSWVLAGQGALADDAKKEVVKDIIEWITLDTSEDGLQYAWANGLMSADGTKDTVASNVVLKKSDGTLDFLGGQDMFDAFTAANDAANGRVLTQYDETINSKFRDAVRGYCEGTFKTADEAIEAFKQNVADELDVEI